jgi:hypothetical protein
MIWKDGSHEKELLRSEMITGEETERVFETPGDVAIWAVKYFLIRQMKDPNLAYYAGRMSEVYRRMCLAMSAVNGTDPEDEEKRWACRGLDQEPDVKVLRRRIEELEQ